MILFSLFIFLTFLRKLINLDLLNSLTTSMSIFLIDVGNCVTLELSQHLVDFISVVNGFCKSFSSRPTIAYVRMVSVSAYFGYFSEIEMEMFHTVKHVMKLPGLETNHEEIHFH